MERDLHNAFHQGQFYLCYQPIVASDSSIVGAEALIRWEHPELGLVTPVQFLPLAVEIGLIREIGKWALFTATKQLRQWLDLHDIYISINLSAPEFENELLGEIVGAALRQAGDLDPRHIKFEITETDEMLSPQKSINKMVELNRIGVDIYIDDFGSGLSSLQYLKQLPAQTLKIDRGFIKNIEEEQSEREFLKTIIDMAENRGKQVIVEGVSSEKQYTLLREMGCPYMQGYYFSKPMPADEFTDLLSRARSLPR
jgi:EAL domain-containing protein (putative c-di-GMP-specific phosphodiesterase class I)